MPENLKNDIRKNAIKQRDMLSRTARREYDRIIHRSLVALPAVQDARKILLYASYRSEVGTLDLIEILMKTGKTVVLPKVVESTGGLTKHIITGLHEIKPGFKDIPEPITAPGILVEDVDIVIVPGVAFDINGARIGYGGGYYDRLLPRIKGIKPIVALAYEEQVLDSVPAEPHDIAMDIIVTPERVITCDG